MEIKCQGVTNWPNQNPKLIQPLFTLAQGKNIGDKMHIANPHIGI
jgi:hypothetical protein